MSQIAIGQPFKVQYIFLWHSFQPTFPKALDVISNIKSTVKQQTRTNSTLKKMNLSSNSKNNFEIKPQDLKITTVNYSDSVFAELADQLQIWLTVPE